MVPRLILFLKPSELSYGYKLQKSQQQTNLLRASEGRAGRVGQCGQVKGAAHPLGGPVWPAPGLYRLLRWASRMCRRRGQLVRLIDAQRLGLPASALGEVSDRT